VAVSLPKRRFDELVDAAIDSVPQELIAHLDNVVLLVQDEPDPAIPGLLGLYEGIALTERDSRYGGELPDRITIFRNPILRICHTEQDVVREVRTTVLHELAHHFGIDDDRLEELGY
jgi:predicted Zn-dependent protease with MMP-like domain